MKKIFVLKRVINRYMCTIVSNRLSQNKERKSGQGKKEEKYINYIRVILDTRERYPINILFFNL